jgi:hypothetical protein
MAMKRRGGLTNMPWKISIHPDGPVVETSYSGILTMDELFDAALETLSVAKAHGITLLLGDCSALEGGHSVFNLYDLADRVLATGLDHSFREAVIVPDVPESAQLVKFWETTCINRGITVQIFNDRQRALDWLLKPE